MKITDLVMPVTFAVAALFISPGLPAADEPHHIPIENPDKDPSKQPAGAAAVEAADSKSADAKAAPESKAADPLARILAKETGDEFEASFLDLMSQHHHVGIRMAGLASSNTENTALRALSSAMVETQGKEADQMEKWLRAWHKQTPGVQKMPEEIAKDQEKALARLEKAKGAEFDKDFANAMIVHHGQGIAIARLAADRATHEEVKTLAVSMIKHQEADVEALQIIAK